ncbi:MAG TPA: flagellar basal-body rod protein FlgF [bacterium]|nr:flagellar basal-body rod protein FlgF [bacterium]
MIRGIERLAKDMTVKMMRQEAVANNLANATTSGYKTQRPFVTVLQNAVGSTQPAGQSQVTGLYTDFTEGPIDSTERPLDFAIEGDGFFVIDTPQGLRYTRNGNFTLSEDGTLVTQAGYRVMGSGGPITINSQNNTDNITMTAEGLIYSGSDQVGALKIVTFDNPEALVSEGNMFASPSGEGRQCDMKTTQVIQGALERSNVSPVDQMVEMITVGRGFETDQKSIMVQDDSAKQLIDRAGKMGA